MSAFRRTSTRGGPGRWRRRRYVAIGVRVDGRRTQCHGRERWCCVERALDDGCVSQKHRWDFIRTAASQLSRSAMSRRAVRGRMVVVWPTLCFVRRAATVMVHRTIGRRLVAVGVFAGRAHLRGSQSENETLRTHDHPGGDRQTTTEHGEHDSRILSHRGVRAYLTRRRHGSCDL